MSSEEMPHPHFYLREQTKYRKSLISVKMLPSRFQEAADERNNS
jgi:hypothetical protein